uniref:MAGUK p55 subfamily member 7 n=1 Tax=Plectus sambesii TaxID=2011161 RepID=A0A914VXZ7_9BILA
MGALLLLPSWRFDWRSLITPTDGDAADYRSRLDYRSDGRLAMSQAGRPAGHPMASVARGRSYWRRRRRTGRFVRWPGIPLIIEHSRLLRPCAGGTVGDASRHGARAMRPPAVVGSTPLRTPVAYYAIARRRDRSSVALLRRAPSLNVAPHRLGRVICDSRRRRPRTTGAWRRSTDKTYALLSFAGYFQGEDDPANSTSSSASPPSSSTHQSGEEIKRIKAKLTTMPDVSGDHSEEEYNAELKELRENAKNLGECLHALLRRIDELEMRKEGVDQATSARSYDRPPSLGQIGKPLTFESSDPGSRHVHVETSEVVGEDGTTKITKRTQVTERVMTTKTYQTLASPDGEYKDLPLLDEWKMTTNTIHDGPLQPCVVGFRSKKGGGDHLGLNVREQNGQLLVDSVDASSPLAKQGLIHSGDSILEVNGHEVRSKDELEKHIKQSGDGISLKLVPSRLHEAPVDSVYYRAMFDYEPFKDDQVPCKSIGLAFKSGEIIQVVSKDDANWWQARKVNDLSRVGLVPSDAFEEKRKSTSNGKQRRKAQNSPRTGHIYEEVGKLSPFGRRVLVLIGAPGIQKDVDQGLFVEWGEYGNNLYGTSVQSVRSVIRSGRMCVLDCSPQAVRYLYNREFMPYVVFLAPPSLEELKQLYQVHPNRTKNKTEEDMKHTCEESARIEAQHSGQFDLVLVNRNVDVTFRRLLDALDALKSETQWVPVSWLY